MNATRPKLRYALCLVLLLSSTLLAVESASADDDPWRLELTAGTTFPTDSEVDGSASFGLGIEYRFNRRLGLELGIAHTDIEETLEFSLLNNQVDFVIRTEVDVTPVLARLHWHLTPDAKVDVSVGPVVGWMRSGDLRITQIDPAANTLTVDIESDDAFTWGAHISLDVPLGGGPFYFTSNATYLEADIEGTENGFSGELSLESLLVQAGFGLRF